MAEVRPSMTLKTLRGFAKPPGSDAFMSEGRWQSQPKWTAKMSTFSEQIALFGKLP
jgi:hypothetical protein